MNSADWWAKKLQQNNVPTQQTPVGRPVNNIPMPPSQQPLAAMPQFQAQTPQTERAQSAKQTASCPECGSGNYMAVANAAPRCYDCGYPVTQSGSRYGTLTGARVEGGVKAASGNDVANGWNPMPPGYNADGTKQY